MVIIINISLLKINSNARNKKNEFDSERSDEEVGEWNFHLRGVVQRIGSP